MTPLKRLAPFFRFGRGLKEFLDTSLSMEETRALIRRRLQNREQMFLDMLDQCVYSSPRSPYRRLLNHAGCERQDLVELLHEHGLEEALQRLQKEGVYISIDEFKGRSPINRGSLTFAVEEEAFDNPAVRGDLVGRTGATRSAGTRTIYDFTHLEQKMAPYQQLRLAAYDALEAPLAVWLPIMPGAGPISVLGYVKGGIVPDRWFSHVQARGFRPALKNRIGTNFIVYAARALGKTLPAPSYVSIDEAEVVARWMRDTLREHGQCVLSTYISSAARVGQVAAHNGWDLSGAVFSVSSEPFTRAKERDICSSGGTAFPMYAFMEAGQVGLACAAKAEADEQHVLTDTTAVISRRRKAPRIQSDVDALLFTTLLSSSPKVMLNTENGDSGRLFHRKCGCVLEEMDFGLHLSDIRSFDKLTAEGMSFSGEDLARIVEEVLPAHFGGDSTCFQMREEEDTCGKTRMVVMVDPSLEQIDDGAVIDVVLSALRQDSDAQRMMARIWEAAGTVCVRHEPPIPTARGKLLPVLVGH